MAVSNGLRRGRLAPCPISRLGGGLTRLSTLNRLRVACSTGTFPQTVVIATTSSSGERKASRIASASSTPGSVSMMTRVNFPIFSFLLRGWVERFPEPFPTQVVAHSEHAAGQEPEDQRIELPKVILRVESRAFSDLVSTTMKGPLARFGSLTDFQRREQVSCLRCPHQQHDRPLASRGGEVVHDLFGKPPTPLSAGRSQHV